MKENSVPWQKIILSFCAGNTTFPLWGSKMSQHNNNNENNDLLIPTIIIFFYFISSVQVITKSLDIKLSWGSVLLKMCAVPRKENCAFRTLIVVINIIIAWIVLFCSVLVTDLFKCSSVHFYRFYQRLVGCLFSTQFSIPSTQSATPYSTSTATECVWVIDITLKYMQSIQLQVINPNKSRLSGNKIMIWN